MKRCKRQLQASSLKSRSLSIEITLVYSDWKQYKIYTNKTSKRVTRWNSIIQILIKTQCADFVCMLYVPYLHGFVFFIAETRRIMNNNKNANWEKLAAAASSKIEARKMRIQSHLWNGKVFVIIVRQFQKSKPQLWAEYWQIDMIYIFFMVDR